MGDWANKIAEAISNGVKTRGRIAAELRLAYDRGVNSARSVDQRDAQIAELRKTVAELQEAALENESSSITSSNGNTMVYMPDGKSFYCECGSNVFHKPDPATPKKLVCNGCLARYIGS